MLSLNWTPLHDLLVPSYHPEKGKTMKKRELAIMAVLAAGG
jgi:hypothetical protein